MTKLNERHCEPCRGDTPRLDAARVAELLGEIEGWAKWEGKLHREFTFHDFAEAMRFVNRMAEVAEAERHHPDFCVHWNRVEVTIWTHAIGGLSENDFILAAKISTGL